VSQALPAAADAWQRLLRPLGVRSYLRGVFSFGAPQVAFTAFEDSYRCALGDLLLVVEDVTNQTRDRRALLLQCRDLTANQNERRAEQVLFRSWPPFRFVAPEYDSQTRAFADDGTFEAGSVATVDLLSAQPRWTVIHDPEPPGRPGESLGATLVGVLVGRLGQADDEGASDWSLTLDDLMKRTLTATRLGLWPHPRFRAAETYRGDHASGAVVFEGPSNSPVGRVLAQSRNHIPRDQEGPISLVHLLLHRL
jgi:hypothetical protein